jgi:hypothetical protein
MDTTKRSARWTKPTRRQAAVQLVGNIAQLRTAQIRNICARCLLVYGARRGVNFGIGRYGASYSGNELKLKTLYRVVLWRSLYELQVQEKLLYKGMSGPGA